MSSWWVELEGRGIEFTGGWVTVSDVPPFLRLSEFLSSLADWCGGLEDGEKLGGESYGWTRFAIGLGETLMALFR